MRARPVMFVVAATCAVLACSETIELGGDGSGAPILCDPNGPQCNDCADNDNDGVVDGFDPECTGALDDDEGSFATGIPGDNQNEVDHDCFFDGNSGSGNDGCDLHVCCLLDLMGGECPADLQPQRFDPDDCTPSVECVESCSPLTPTGCDCFGCCTVCVGDSCADILLSPEVSAGCSSENLDDTDACRRCVKRSGCGTDCDLDQCVLCPGQSVDDLPAGCEQTCPNNAQRCGDEAGCPAGEFCANGCCIGIPQ